MGGIVLIERKSIRDFRITGIRKKDYPRFRVVLFKRYSSVMFSVNMPLVINLGTLHRYIFKSVYYFPIIFPIIIF